MTPTPITDARANNWKSTDGQWVNAEFARWLERELFACREWSSKLADVTDDLRAELAAERELADRLLSIAEKAVSDHEGTLHCGCDCKCSGRRIANDNAESLVAWKEARSGTV